MSFTDGVLVRLNRTESDIEKLDREKADTKDLEALGRQFEKLSESVDSLRKAIIAFAFVVAGSAVAFAFTVLQLVGT